MKKAADRIQWLWLIFIFTASAYADYGILRGTLKDSNLRPLTGVELNLESHSSESNFCLMTDKSGKFHSAGMLPGVYRVYIRLPGYKSIKNRHILVEPGREIFIQAFLALESSQIESRMRVLDLDYSGSSYQTFLPEERIHDMPSAHNIWALLENQDLSAISNRIDVGGWWNGIPGLFSSRGSCSWTQNRYLLNGMDVTDPYQTGKPLFYPDYFSLQSYNLVNAGHPPGYVHPGGYLDCISLPETRSLHGSFSGFFLHDALQDSNITNSHQDHGLEENHTFNHLSEGNIQISGPLFPDKLFFSSSFSAFDISRNAAEFPDDVPSSLISGLFSLKATLSGYNLKFLWTGQNLHHPAHGADRGIPYSSTNDRRENFQVYQLLFQPALNPRYHIVAGIAFSRGDTTSAFQENVLFPYSAERFNNPAAGAAPDSSRNIRSALTFMLKGLAFLSPSSRMDHVVRCGIQLQQVAADSEITVFDNQHLHFFEGKPLEVVQVDSPYRHREAGFHGHAYLQDTLSFSNLFSVYLGGILSFSQGRGVDDSGNSKQNRISWINYAPRLGVIIPMNRAKTSVFKLSFHRYHFTLPLSYMSYGNPEAPGARIYVWNDYNQDHLFQTDERGELWRREGPAFAEIDPEIKRPYMDEAALSYQTVFGKHWSFTLAGFFRATRNLIRTVNIGVPLIGSYAPLYHIDAGDDQIPFTYDDLIFTVFDQTAPTLGKDFYQLTNAESETRTTNYFGMDLYLLKKWGDRFTFFLTFTAIHCIGNANPGNTAWENDDGVIGNLFHSPNSLINAEGRLHFDRGYTARIGFRWVAPLGFRISAVAKYYDGQPFSRLKIIPDLNQGPVFIQTSPRGTARYSFNQTVDIRIEKIFDLGRGRLKFMLDGFNMLNLALDTEEEYWTGPEYPERYPTEIQSPRVFRLGMAYEF
jgi:hypothetical protein